MRDSDEIGGPWAMFALAWLGGTALHLRLASLPPEGMLWTSLACAFLLLGIGWRWRHGLLLALAAMAAIAFASAGLQAGQRLDDRLAEPLEGVDLVVTGVVASLPGEGSTGLRFLFEVESATREGVPVRVPRRLSVGWFTPPFGSGARVLSHAQRRLGAGQRWQFTLRLRQPHGLLNPHGFDQELKWFEQGIGATAAVRDKPSPKRLDPAAAYPIERFRQRIRDAILATVPDRSAAGMLVALTIGEQGVIDKAEWEVYRATGVAHLVAISGLHLSMFAWLAGTLVGRLWRLSRRGMLWLPAPLAACWGGFGCAALYAVCSGFGLPAQRTLCMLGVVTLSRSLGVRWPWHLVLLTAAALVSALDPWALLQPGFWLSFVAVGLLTASSPPVGAQQSAPAAEAKPGWRDRRRRAWAKLNGDLRTQLVATAGLAPLTLVFFQQVSVVGFGANVLAIPVVTLLVMPLCLAGVFLPPLWIPAAWTVGWLHAVLGALSAWPGAVWSAAAAPLWAQLGGLAGAALMVLPLPWRARALSGLLLLPLMLPPRQAPPPGGFDLVAVDVGQGTAVLVRTERHVLVYDAGPGYSVDSDAGERVLVPLLKARGDTRIDRMVLSHRDTDHVGGADSLLRAFPVRALMSSLEPSHRLRGLAGEDIRCEAGQAWDWDGVRFEVLHPPAAAYAKAAKPNALSCVLRIQAAGRSALLTGDIERAQETALVAADPGALRSDLVTVPHHGSKTSSSAAFLDAVGARVAVVQAGYRNRFHHPVAEVLARYRSRGVRVVQSPACGAFTLGWSDPIEGRCIRDEQARYWRHRIEPPASEIRDADG